MSKELGKDSTEELSADDHDDSSPNESESESESTDSSDSDSDYQCTVCNKKFSGALPLRQHQKGSKHKKVLARKKKERKLLNKEDDEEEDEDGQGHIIPEPYRICKTCDKEFYGLEPYQQHLKSKAHKQKILHASILEQAKENGEINVDKLRDLYLSKKASAPRKPSDVPDNSKEGHASSSKTDEDDLDEHDKEDFECKDCGKTFCGLIPFGQHLTSKTHARQVEKKSLLGKITSENVEDINKISQNDSLAVEDGILVCKTCSTSFSGPENAMSHLKSQKHAKKLDKYLRKLEKKKKKAAKPKEPDSDLTGSEDNEAPEGRKELHATIFLRKLEKKNEDSAKPEEPDSDLRGSEGNEAAEGKDEVDANVSEKNQHS